MEYLIPVGFLIIGFIALYFGAEWLVRGAGGFGLKVGLTPVVVGLTIVAFGTSSPELFVSLQAALDGKGDISLGNVIGSNICNIALILGLSSVIRPMTVQAQFIKFDTPVMIGISVLVVGFLWDGIITFGEGLFLFILLIGYILMNIYLSKKETAKISTEFEELEELEEAAHDSTWKAITLIIVGLMGLYFGSKWFVEGAVLLAKGWGVTDAVIGITVIALGTSLPELATSVVAAIKKSGDIAIGNIIGSNVFNLLGILGVTAMVVPLTAANITTIDYLVMLGVSILILPMMRIGMKITRIEGVILLLIYVAYTYYLFTNVQG